ncbi:MAG: HD domain-containing protein [Candidatus Hydrogenedentes bacterium]|nr:HD domain-containing protein [Candidatus Hydrogenedentota bacterium]
MKYRLAVSLGQNERTGKVFAEDVEDFPHVIDLSGEKVSLSGVLMILTDNVSNEGVRDAIDVCRNEYDSLFFLIADAIDCRESLKPGGARRMVKIARYLGSVLGLSTSEQWVLEHACVLRDIGKIQVSNEILLKKSVLSYEEWIMLKSHPKLGADILKGLGIFPELIPVIESHHECYDGDGYPLGIEGEEIPFLARVLKVLDVYCAMTSFRIYRSGIATKEEALEHLKDERGKHFDPKVVDAFIEAKVVEREDVPL